MTKFFNMNTLEGQSASTAEAMFDSVDQQFEKHTISWDYFLMIGVDNTNAIIGEHNSIKSHALEKNKNRIISGCVCHILHNAS